MAFVSHSEHSVSTLAIKLKQGFKSRRSDPPICEPAKTPRTSTAPSLDELSAAERATRCPWRNAGGGWPAVGDPVR
jgi:hypothetical protein